MSHPTTEPSTPAQGLAPWFGGKARLAKAIIARIEAVDHACYAEPFIGMGGVFLRRTSRPKVEAINDLNGEIANLFRCVQRHTDAVCAALEPIASYGTWRRLQETPPASLTDIERAARFLFIQYGLFGGRVSGGGTWRRSTTTQSGWGRARVSRIVRAASQRLDRAFVDQLDFERFVQLYDRPHTLFYVDPPYVGLERVYGRDMFAAEDHARLAEVLTRAKGKWILSLNDTPLARQLYATHRIEEVQVSYSMKAKRATELLVTNF